MALLQQSDIPFTVADILPPAVFPVDYKVHTGMDSTKRAHEAKLNDEQS